MSRIRKFLQYFSTVVLFSARTEQINFLTRQVKSLLAGQNFPAFVGAQVVAVAPSLGQDRLEPGMARAERVQTDFLLIVEAERLHGGARRREKKDGSSDAEESDQGEPRRESDPAAPTAAT